MSKKAVHPYFTNEGMAYCKILCNFSKALTNQKCNFISLDVTTIMTEDAPR